MYLFTLIMMTLLFPLILVYGGISRKMHPYAVILQSVLIMTTGFVLLFVFAWSTGEPLSVSILKEIEISVAQMVRSPEVLNLLGLSETTGSDAIEILMEVYGMMVNLLPSTILSWGVVLSYLYYMFLSKLRNKLGRDTETLPAFSDFSLPRRAIAGSLLIYFLSWIAVTSGIVLEETMLLNVRALVEFVFALQGLAVSLYMVKQKRIPKIISVLVFVMLFMSGIGRMFLAMLGFFDLIVGLRQKIEKQ